MIFKPAQIVQYISSLMCLEEGDLIYTGTPAGVGKVERGDNITAKILPFAELTAEVI
ncbi:MAG: fumarylacetoacetate hydrolase family protein [Ignavibacteriales bacterium]|nr:fumarylacetoacetate hydrolase family protein [Ignavibacteriales bacterium]